MKRTFFAGMSVAALTSLGGAQTPGRPALTAAECQVAAQALGAGSRETWRWERIAECGSNGAAALTAALTAARSTTDSVFLSALFRTASRVRDTGLWQASMNLGADKSAAVPARVVGMLVSAAQYEPGLIPVESSWARFVTVPIGTACRLERSEQTGWTSDLGIQTDYLQSTAGALSATSVDQTEPAVVRELAGCLRAYLSEVPQVIDPALITLEYVCGTKYRVSNASPFRITVSYALFHGPERGELTVPPNGSAFIVTNYVYGISLFYQGQAVREAQYAGTACPP